jgi:hypothetical protein
MAKDKATVKADGKVSVSDLAVIVDSMAKVLSALTAETTDNPAVIEWVVEGLKAGSATVTTRGIGATYLALHTIQRVIERYELLARKAHNGLVEDFPPPVQSAVRTLSSLVNGRITRISLSADDDAGEWSISPKLSEGVRDEDSARPGIDVNRYARTCLRGQIVTLDAKHSTYFTLREAHTGQLLRCYPSPSYRPELGKWWATGAWVIVEGTYSRYTDPPTMLSITNITPFENAPPGSWRDAAGCAPRRPGTEDISSAEMVRRIRDG